MSMEKSHHFDGIINQDSVSGISHRLCYSFWWWIFHLTQILHKSKSWLPSPFPTWHRLCSNILATNWQNSQWYHNYPSAKPKKNGLLSGVSHFFIGCWHFKTQDIWGQDLITNLTIWFKNNSWIILDHFGRIIGVRSFDLALFHPPSGFINALKLVPQLMFEEVTSQQASFGALL